MCSSAGICVLIFGTLEKPMRKASPKAVQLSDFTVETSFKIAASKQVKLWRHA